MGPGQGLRAEALVPAVDFQPSCVDSQVLGELSRRLRFNRRLLDSRLHRQMWASCPQRPPPSLQRGETEACRGRPRTVTQQGAVPGGAGPGSSPARPVPRREGRSRRPPGQGRRARRAWRAPGRGRGAGAGGRRAPGMRRRRRPGGAARGRAGARRGGGRGPPRGSRPCPPRGRREYRAPSTGPDSGTRASSFRVWTPRPDPLDPGCEPLALLVAHALLGGTKAGVDRPSWRAGGSGRHGACRSAGSSPRADRARGFLLHPHCVEIPRAERGRASAGVWRRLCSKPWPVVGGPAAGTRPEGLALGAEGAGGVQPGDPGRGRQKTA